MTTYFCMKTINTKNNEKTIKTIKKTTNIKNNKNFGHLVHILEILYFSFQCKSFPSFFHPFKRGKLFPDHVRKAGTKLEMKV